MVGPGVIKGRESSLGLETFEEVRGMLSKRSRIWTQEEKEDTLHDGVEDGDRMSKGPVVGGRIQPEKDGPLNWLMEEKINGQLTKM